MRKRADPDEETIDWRAVCGKPHARFGGRGESGNALLYPYTSDKWIPVLLENGIKISMDSRGRALDNIFVERLWRSVKYEDIYPKNYTSMPELLLGLAEYFVFYNGERYHQALGYKTPDQVYLTGEGGGAKIVD